MRWNYTKSLLFVAACGAIVAGVVGAFGGNPERGLGQLIVSLVVGLPIVAVADLISAWRERRRSAKNGAATVTVTVGPATSFSKLLSR